jgi:hypothetical protein
MFDGRKRKENVVEHIQVVCKAHLSINNFYAVVRLYVHCNINLL